MRLIVWLGVLIACGPRAACGDDAPAVAAGDDAVVAVPVDSTFYTRLSSLLDEGFRLQPEAATAAVAHFERLQKQRPDDPRIQYALALVLLKNFQQAEAIDHLEAAIRVDSAYLPAWRLRLGLLLKSKEYAQVSERLYELADVVGRAAPSPPSMAVREQTAAYMGRVVAFLQGPLGDYEVAEQACQLAKNLDALLGEGLHESFTAGRINLTREHHALLDEVELLTDAAAADKLEQLAEAEAEGAELESERDTVKRTQEQWDAIIKEEVGEIDSKLGALEKRHDSVQQELVTLSDAIIAMRVEMQRLAAIRDDAIRDANDGPRRRMADTRGIDVRLAALQLELDQHLGQYDASLRERVQILQAAQGFMRQRQSSLNNYQRATGKAAERVQQLDRWTERIETAAAEAEMEPAAEARPVNALRRRIRNWTTFENLDLDSEKVRLIAEYSVVP
jgi:tetratricopeptide (TPR) repeat protein